MAAPFKNLFIMKNEILSGDDENLDQEKKLKYIYHLE